MRLTPVTLVTPVTPVTPVTLVTLVLLTVLLSLSQSSLTPPLDKGVVVKVSEQLIRDIARAITDKAVGDIKDLMMSGEIRESGVKFEYWHLRFTNLTMAPTVDLTKDPARDKLLLDGTIRGDLSAAARWRATKKTWFYDFLFDGGVTVRSSGYDITARVILGENEEGVVGFTHDPSACTVDLGGLDLNFTGSKLSWLINLFIGFFEGEIRDVLEHYICIEINEKVKEGASELENAVFDRYDFVHILGHRVEINNRPTRVTGGDSCLIVTGLGETDLEMEDRNETETAPFFPPTKPPKEKEEDKNEFETTGTTEFTTGFTSSSSVVYLETLPSPPSTGGMVERRKRDTIVERRRRRETEDWCSVLPGAGRGVAVIITESVISRFAEDLHQLRMIDYTATQGTGTSEEYQVEWSGKNVGTMRIPTKDHEVLKNFQVTFRVTSTAAPSVVINPEGVAVFSQLRARVTLVGTNSLLIKVEIHTTLKFTGTLAFVFEDGVYLLVPEVVGSSDITNAKFTMGGSATMKVPAPIVQEVERQLDEMLGQMLPALIREELKTGYPLNIPDNLLINDATIQYKEDYILITADDVVVNL